MNTLNFPGSRWWKFDFHTHTPIGSMDYKGDKALTPDAWLQAYRDNGLDCVVVTDHNSGHWVNDLNAALLQFCNQDVAWQTFYIFPGVEISCSGGIHLIALLDTGKTSQDIAALVGACGYYGTLGDSDQVTDQSVEQVISVIHARGGVAIAAHIDAAKGLFCATKDETTRLQVLDKVDAVHIVNLASSVLEDKGEESRKKLKSLAPLQSSDNHDAKKLEPDCFTWVKLTTPNLQGLKLALAEPDLSIFRSDQHPDSPQDLPRHWIKRLSLEGLDKRRQRLQINFNPWLNTIIGGRGSGKSSLVECLRLALGRADEAKTMLGPEHEVSKAIAKFSLCMVRDETQLEATVMGAGDLGGRYRYDWRKISQRVMRPVGDALDEWVDTGIEARAIPSEFRVRVFSQKQIHALANRPEGLLAYFDEPGNATTAEAQAALNQCVAVFKRDRARVRELRQELKNWPQIRDQLSQVRQSLAEYTAQGVSEKLVTLQVLRAERRALTDFQQGLQSEIRQTLQSWSKPALADWQVDLPVGASVQAQALAEKWHQERDVLEQQWQAILALCQVMQKRADALPEQPEFMQWQSFVTPLEQDCLQALEQVKTQLGGQLQKVGVLQQQKEQLELQDKLYTAKSQHLQDLVNLALASYQNVLKGRQRLTQVRQEFVQKVIGNDASPILKITIHAAAQFDNSSKENLRRLLELKNAEYANAFLGNTDDEDSTGILVTLAKNPDKLDDFKKGVQDLVNAPDLGLEKILDTPVHGVRIRDALKSLADEQLDNLWTWFAQDRVEIQFRVTPHDRWQDISQGSAGQQTGALLSFILNQGDEPLILDQPEDDLDNAMVYDLVVQQLRSNKSRRQVIVVTHNANIVVNGDAELVIPMAFRGGQIQADSANGLQDMAIRQTICNVMEGGKIAFDKRYKRVLKDMK